MASSAYAPALRQVRSALPDLPGARCKGRAPDFDDGTSPQTAAFVILTCCQVCPVARECGRIRRSPDAGGVWAGRYYVTHRGRAYPAEITWAVWRDAAESAAAAGYDTREIRALLGKLS